MKKIGSKELRTYGLDHDEFVPLKASSRILAFLAIFRQAPNIPNAPKVEKAALMKYANPIN